VTSVRANRAFLARAVRFLAAEAGIGQFLDIGTGIPAANNTHEVAQSAAPGSRVVYVDYDHCKSGCTHTCRAPDHRRPPGTALPGRM
jgi:S-adenosyl methyltransferase